MDDIKELVATARAVLDCLPSSVVDMHLMVYVTSEEAAKQLRDAGWDGTGGKPFVRVLDEL